MVGGSFVVDFKICVVEARGAEFGFRHLPDFVPGIEEDIGQGNGLFADAVGVGALIVTLLQKNPGLAL